MSKGEECISLARALDWRIAVAESCTGGLLGGALTSVSGASSVFEGGAITYSNEAKVELLGVDPALFASVGAVSREVASSMARGARERLNADVAISLTGIAGPSGGTALKPVGTVFIGVATRNGSVTHHHQFTNADRAKVRSESVMAALGHLHDVMKAEARDLG